MVLPNPLPLPISIFFAVVIQPLIGWKVDLVFTILNVMCECVSAALEQVAGNRLVYVLGGFGCAVVAIGFAVSELLWMKVMNQNIGILDWLGFLAALSQVSSSGLHVVFVCLHKSSPINFSVFSLIFALVAAYYKIIWKSRTHEFVVYCKNNRHSQSLKVCEIHPKKTVFECPSCADLSFVYGAGDFICEEELSRARLLRTGGFSSKESNMDGAGGFSSEEIIDGDEEFSNEERIDNKKEN